MNNNNIEEMQDKQASPFWGSALKKFADNCENLECNIKLVYLYTNFCEQIGSSEWECLLARLATSQSNTDWQMQSEA